MLYTWRGHKVLPDKGAPTSESQPSKYGCDQSVNIEHGTAHDTKRWCSFLTHSFSLSLCPSLSLSFSLPLSVYMILSPSHSLFRYLLTELHAIEVFDLWKSFQMARCRSLCAWTLVVFWQCCWSCCSSTFDEGRVMVNAPVRMENMLVKFNIQT